MESYLRFGTMINNCKIAEASLEGRLNHLPGFCFRTNFVKTKASVRSESGVARSYIIRIVYVLYLDHNKTHAAEFGERQKAKARILECQQSYYYCETWNLLLFVYVETSASSLRIYIVNLIQKRYYLTLFIQKVLFSSMTLYR